VIKGKTGLLALAAAMLAAFVPGMASASSVSARMPVKGVPTAHLGALKVNDDAHALLKWGASIYGANCSSDPRGQVGIWHDDLYLRTTGAYGNCAKVQSPDQLGYGTYEAYLRVQGGPNGTISQWPAFYGSGPDWPKGGEIDAFEAMGGADYASFDPGLPAGHLYGAAITSTPRWHTVVVVWGPGSLKIYTDGRLSRNWRSSYLRIKRGGTQPMSWTFDNASWQGSSGDYGYDSRGPSTMLVRYFRYWAWKA
jgi:hypothetical protein